MITCILSLRISPVSWEGTGDTPEAARAAAYERARRTMGASLPPIDEMDATHMMTARAGRVTT